MEAARREAERDPQIIGRRYYSTFGIVYAIIMCVGAFLWLSCGRDFVNGKVRTISAPEVLEKVNRVRAKMELERVKLEQMKLERM